MYAKLFSRITESSLMEEPINVRYTFVMMLAIADPEGYVIGTDVAIARRLNMPLDEFLECLAVLMAPDPHSNSQELDGRRVTVSTGERGYHVVNFVTYRDLKDPTERREYMREYMRDYRKRRSQPVSESTVTEGVNSRKLDLAELTHAEADAYAEEEAKEEEKKRVSPGGRSSPGSKSKASKAGITRPAEVPEQAWNDWLAVRSAKRAGPVTQTAWNRVLSEADKASISPAEAVKTAASKSWSGFEAEWYQNISAHTRAKQPRSEPVNGF